MIPTPNQDDPLERALHGVLRELPPRRAPRSLEQRVLAEIARRAALPWWRKSFVHWPIAARAVFIVLIIGVVKFALMGAVWVMAGFDVMHVREAFAAPFAWMEAGLTVMRAISSFFEIMLRNIPPLWLYGGVAIVASLYFALFGLGAAAYRTLYAQR